MGRFWELEAFAAAFEKERAEAASLEARP
jgi:hypothetical protein